MAIIQRAQSSVAGLPAALTTLQSNIDTEVTNRGAAVGDLTTLTTTAKGSAVAAINEVAAAATGAAKETDVLLKASNLSDVADATAALANLGGIDQAALTSAIDAAKLAAGTSHDAADIAARDALTGLTTADRVFVANDGDSKWAIYKPTAVDGNGSGTAWLKLYDQDALENSLTAAGVKAAYESNSDTNAFTDADKAKLAFITVAAAIDLATVLVEGDIATSLTSGSTDNQVASAKAVYDLVQAGAGGGASVVLESLVVATGGVITLSHAPKGGLAGILNFATVRYVDGNGVAYDAPAVAVDGQTEQFTISTDSANQWDGNTVQVQYVY